MRIDESRKAINNLLLFVDHGSDFDNRVLGTEPRRFKVDDEPCRVQPPWNHCGKTRLGLYSRTIDHNDDASG